MSLNVAHGNGKVCNFLSTAQKLSHCSVIQLKLFFSPIQMRVLPPALPPDQRCGGLLSMYYSLWVVCHKETARPHQTKYYTVPSLPSGPETFPTANKRNTFGLTQIMFMRPTHKITGSSCGLHGSFFVTRQSHPHPPQKIAVTAVTTAS